MSNVRIKKSLGWKSGLVYDSQFYANQYQADISMLVVSDNTDEQNIAYDRVKSWIKYVLEDSVIITHTDSKLRAWQNTGARVIVLPEEPVDQIMGIMLYLKLNSIMENRMVVTDVELSSSIGDSTRYLHSHGEALGESLSQAGWWLDPSPAWYTVKKNSRNPGKIVNLDRGPEWSDHDLSWEKDINQKDHADSVVFASFNRDENK